MMSTTTANQKTGLATSFEVRVAKETFKFNAAHFVTFQNFRERLHGHNYQVSVRLLGSRKIGSDGYVIDFGDIKAVTKRVCKDLNEHFLCPTLSDVMNISIETSQNGKDNVKLECQDGSIFVFPRSDCAMLPIVHATTEELAIYLWSKILSGLDASFLLKRGIHTLEVTVAEAVGQEATFRYEIPDTQSPEVSLDVRQFIEKGEIMPTPCLPTKPNDEHFECDGNCRASKHIFSTKLRRLAKSINQGGLTKHTNSENNITPEELEEMMK